MTPKIRRFLFIFFIIAFLVITPWLSLYAAGYKIELNWPLNFKKTLQKTGMFVLNTSPRNAKIFIDNKPSQLFFKKYFNKEQSYLTTPAKIKNILPGEYDVRLELPGYWPWGKKLTIQPGQSTYAEDIYLFKKDLPLQIISMASANKNFSRIPIRKIDQSPNKKYFLVLNEEKITILEINNNNLIIIPLVSLGDQIKSDSPILWSPDNEKVLVGKIIFNLKDKNDLIYLDKLIGKDADNLKWDKNNPNRLYYQYADSINYFDLNTKSKKTLIKGKEYLDHLIKNDYIFFISQASKIVKLEGIALKTGETVKEIELPSSPQYKFINNDHNLINVYDAKHQLLYLLDPLAPVNPLKEIINNIKYTYWINNNKLLYANDFEIWLLDMDNNWPLAKTGKKILTRISEPITDVLWHPSKNYIIYSTNKTINIIELDEREKRNITELIKLDEIYSPSLSPKGDILYFGAKIGQQEGLYKLEIQ